MTKAEELKKAKEILQLLINSQKAKQKKLDSVYKNPDEGLEDINQYILLNEKILYLQKVINHLEAELNNIKNEKKVQKTG